MTKFASRLSGVAFFALSALPFAAMPAPALAGPIVKVSDIDLLTPAGAAVFAQRTDRAAQSFCADVRGLGRHASCVAGVKTEMTEKAAVLQAAQRERASTALAAR